MQAHNHRAMTHEARKLMLKHLDNHQGDVYHTLQYLIACHGYNVADGVLEDTLVSRIQKLCDDSSSVAGVSADSIRHVVRNTLQEIE